MDKELLYLPRKLKKKLFYLQLSEKEILELMDSIPGGNYDEPRVQKSRNLKAPFEKWIDEHIEIEEKIKETAEELYKAIIDLRKQISRIDNQDYQHLLILYYINELSLNDIANKLYVSLITAKRWKYRATMEFEKLIPDDTA